MNIFKKKHNSQFLKDCENDNIQYANYNFEKMYTKINEICDYLKSKGDE